MEDQIDFEFIAKLEGKQKTKAYVPPVKSKSGVTIATGVDIGQMNKAEIMQLDIPTALKKKLIPYAGKKQIHATTYLKEHPLTITKDHVKKLDRAVRRKHVSKLVKNHDSFSSVKFYDLPKEAQTVIASVAFQYGIYLNSSAPKFWGAVIKQDWENTYKILTDFEDSYPTRRNKEAAFLKPIVNTKNEKTKSE